MMKSRQAITTILSAVAIASLVLVSATSAAAGDRHHHDGDADDVTTAISACSYVITAPGRYALASNLSCTADGITIQASHVELELDGHSLTGSNWNTGILVSAAGSLSDVRIEGPGSVTRFGNGIDLESLSDSSVDGVTSTFNGTDGLVTNYSFTSTVTRLRLTHNVVSGNGAWGMILGNIDDSQIRQNAIALNATGGGGGLSGIAIIGGRNNLVQGNVTTGNYGGGILIAAESYSTAATGNRVRDNVASGNSVVGISIASGTGNLVEGNEAFGNSGYPGTYDVTDATPCGTNTWRHNAFATSNEACIVPTVRH
ncbi:MAG TPA: NosD domain-containing protein [Vicinamibacterales bacterium]|nr:NosD domain-containing protein [Vicinamibacterales bacterium]